jgi:hypothetical protein
MVTAAHLAARLRALASYLECEETDLSELSYAPLYGEGAGFEGCGGEWAVLTDAEAYSAWDQSLDSYLEDCVPGSASPYFHTEQWKEDARQDGRGYCLSSYDGNEEEIKDAVTGAWFYVYRTN